MRHRAVGPLLTLLVMSQYAAAQAPAPAPASTAPAPGAEPSSTGEPSPPPLEKKLVVAGGVSLGSYQAGVLYYYSEYLKSRKIKVAASTGASAGAINATMAAIESCRLPQSDPTKSPYWQVWIPVGLDDLLPPKGGSGTPLSVLRRTPLEKAAAYLHAYIEQADGWTSEACQVPVGIVATRLAPEAIAAPIAAKRATERFGFVFDKDIGGRLAHLTDCSLQSAGSLNRGEATTSTCVANKEVIRHPGSNNARGGRPTFGDIRDLLFASSSFPLAFEPVRLTSHGLINGSITNDVYVDGGVFDNIPVKLVQALRGEKLPLVVVDSDNTPWKPTERPLAEFRSLMQAVGAFASGFVGAARTRELLGLEVEVGRPERRAMLTSDYLFAFSGFLDQRFRVFDFYLGMLDARSFVLRDAADAAIVEEFERTSISSRPFTCFKALEALSMGFQQVPDWKRSVEGCGLGPEAAKGDVAAMADGEEKELFELISLFGASVDTQQYATSATGPSELEVFRHFLALLEKSHFTFSLRGESFPAADLIYKLRRVSGEALTQLASQQPSYGTTMNLVSNVALDLALFHLAPDFYSSLGVHLNRGFDADVSWGLGASNQDRIGLGLRLRKFDLLSDPAAAQPSLNLVYTRSWEPSPSFALDFGAETGFGYRFWTTPPDQDGDVPPERKRGARHVIALTAAGVWYDHLYVRADTRWYSRMSTHWPKDYGGFELGFGVGWRFH